MNETLKIAVFEADGIRELLRVVELNGRNPDLLEPALCGLRHLTNAHKKADIAQRNFIYDMRGLPKISRWINPDTKRPCLKAALGVMRNLALKPVNHQIMREERIVHLVLGILSVYMKNVMVSSIARAHKLKFYVRGW